MLSFSVYYVELKNKTNLSNLDCLLKFKCGFCFYFVSLRLYFLRTLMKSSMKSR